MNILRAIWTAIRLISIQLSLRLIGFKRTQAYMWRLSSHPRPRPQMNLQQMKHSAAYIAYISQRLPLPILCLPQSLLLANILRRNQQHATLHIGMTGPNNFAAHAWVESGGHIINDSGTPDSDYRPVLQIDTLI